MPVRGGHTTVIVVGPDHPAWHALAPDHAVAEPAAVTGSGRRYGLSASLLGLILLCSAFLQFYRLNDLQHFQGDEGILVLAARSLLVDHIFPVYGLALAVGSAHIGPLFDYLIALPLLLSGLNPTAAVALNGLCQLLAVGLCYALVVRCGGGRVAGLVAALVYATSQQVVYYSRFLWPNMFPCMVLLLFWSLLSVREGRRLHVVLLGVWLGVALQLQPTGVLLVPFIGAYLLATRPPLSVRSCMLAVLAMAALFAPSIIHDLTHGLVETRAWLGYSRGGTPHDRAISHTLARLAILLQRLLGVHQAPLAAALGAVLAAGVVARSALPSPHPPAPTSGQWRPGLAQLARLLALLSAICMIGYLFFGSQLRPHYMMPIFPVPALAIGLLAAPVARRWTTVSRSLCAPVVAAAVLLAGTNVMYTWQANFLLDRYQITLQPQQSNLITLGQMRAVTSFITQRAGGARFNLFFAAPDDQPYAYQALLLGSGARFGFHPAQLRFLIVQPPDWS